VTYAVAAPVGTFGSLRATYREIHAAIAEGLNSLGAGVRLAADRPAAGVGAGACFASAAGGEVMAERGGKVVGSAQVRLGGAFLQHGSILLAADQDVVAGVTTGRFDPPSATGVADLIGPARATWEAVAHRVAQAAARRWDAARAAGVLPAAVRERALALVPRYADPAWTWRR
jgi:hypothetical protein